MRVPTEIGDDLRERAADPARLEAAIERERENYEALERKLGSAPNELDRTRLGRVLNRLGEHLRLAGDFDEAERCCAEAVEIWEDFGRDRAAYLARLRRADVDVHRDDLQAGARRADRLVRDAESEPFAIYRDFALELRGRVRTLAGRGAEGRADLREALRLRRQRDRQRLVERTERILEIAQDRGD